MVDGEKFKEWLENNTNYEKAAISDVVSRMKRADRIYNWDGSDTYLFFLEKQDGFQKLSMSVKSQLRRAVKYYSAFSETK